MGSETKFATRMPLRACENQMIVSKDSQGFVLHNANAREIYVTVAEQLNILLPPSVGPSLASVVGSISPRVAENRKAHSTFDFQPFGWQPHHMHIFPRPTSLSLHFVHATRHFNAFITRIHTFLSNLIESSEHFLHGRKMGEPRNLEKRGNEWSRDVPQQPI